MIRTEDGTIFSRPIRTAHGSLMARPSFAGAALHDVGWVGAVCGGTDVTDGECITSRLPGPASEDVVLDGREDARRTAPSLFLRPRQRISRHDLGSPVTCVACASSSGPGPEYSSSSADAGPHVEALAVRGLQGELLIDDGRIIISPDPVDEDTSGN